jgi:DNA-binding beta-propeller fold protein YncE
MVGNEPFSVTSADFNNDNKLDLAVANADDNTVSVLLGNGNGTFQTHSKYGVGYGPFCVISGDIKNDNKPDLIVTNRDFGDLSVFLNVCN